MSDATRLGAPGVAMLVFVVLIGDNYEAVESVWSSRREAERHAAKVNGAVQQEALMHTAEQYELLESLNAK